MVTKRKTRSGKALFTKERERAFLRSMEKARESNDVEKAVEGTVNTMVKEGFQALYNTEAEINYLHKTDGVLDVKLPEGTLMALEGEAAQGEGAVSMGALRILLESKRAMDFHSPHDPAVVLIQALCYMQNLRKAGEPPVDGVIVADRSSIFFCHSKYLEPYLDEDHDWNVRPSSAHLLLPELLASLEEDPNLTLHVERYDSPGFSMGEFITRVGLEAQMSMVRAVEVNNKLSMERAWLEYLNGPFGGVLTDPVPQVSLWVRHILGDPGVRLHDKFKNALSVTTRDKKGRLVETRFPTKATQPFSANAHAAYTTKYKRGGYTEAEKKAITEMADVLIEETKRRFHGDYWTPTLWVREAHKVIEEHLGDDWRDNYVVWDPAAGTKNLTRDYRFKELYSSTLHAEELAMAEDYNPEGTAFQYDFLNDDMALHALSQGLFDKKPGEMNAQEKEAFLEEQRGKWKMPDGLLEALVHNKPLAILMNPPYGASASMIQGGQKAGITTSAINKVMVEDKVGGHAAQQLYAQFIYRCQLLATLFGYTENFHIMVFASNTYLTSTNFARFMEGLRGNYRFTDGFMMNAGEFTGTSATWGINFAMWERNNYGTTTPPTVKVLEGKVSDTGEQYVQETGTWVARSVPGDATLSSIIPRPRGKAMSTDTFPTTKNGILANPQGSRGTMTQGAFGYVHDNGASVHFSDNYIGMYSLSFRAGNGIPVDAANILAASTVFAVRKVVCEAIAGEGQLWSRGKDVYPTPSKEFQESDEWGTFTDDCLVMSLFINGSHQTSLREYECGVQADGSPKLWRVDNQFYWGSREHIEEMARKNNADEILDDLEGDTGERFVYKHLERSSPSPEAQILLDKANAILDASFQYRVPFYYDSPLYCTIAWDMGWLQLQRMCFGREALPAAKGDKKLQDLYSEFKVARDALGEKIARRYSEDTGF